MLRIGMLVSVVLIVLGIATIPVRAQPAAGDAPVDTTSALVEIERTLLEEDMERYEQLARRRSATIGELAQLLQVLDDAIRQGDPQSAGRLSELMDRVEQVEGDRTGLLTAERLVVERIETHLRRIALLQREAENLADREEEVPVGLTGTWDLVMLPVEQRGTCTLNQSGALVNGTYRLEGGWTGSLQGTLVNRKVFLIRIDSKLGKSMEFEGYLSGDENQIRGSWLNYELAGSEGSTGQWSAKRRIDE